MTPTPAPAVPARKSFRESQFEIREAAILDATHRLLARHGYDTLAMDDIASEVGIAKGSLYRHFESKDALVGAVMVRLLRRTRECLEQQPATDSARARLEALLRWTLDERLAGGIPHLPATSQALRDSLMSFPAYLDELLNLSESIGDLIRRAKDEGDLNPELDDAFILYAFYARACDPTLDFLRAGGAMSDARIVDQMVLACFSGLQAGALRSPGETS